MENGRKIPHQPKRLIGKWAVALSHELFKIEEVEMGSDGLPVFRGWGLGGQRVATSVPTVLADSDTATLEATLGDRI